MKASILALLVAAAAAQSTEGSATTTALTPLQSCLGECTPSDVNCQAICVGVPHPGEAQMGLVTDCVAQCDQGDGSTAASEAYGRCRDSCLSSYIILSGTAAPGGAYTTAIPPGVSATAAAADASASASAAADDSTASTGASQTAASSRTASGSAAAASTSGSAAGMVTAQYGGVFGMLLGALAML